MVFPVVTHGCESWTIRRRSIEELILLNCDDGEDFWESLGLQRDQASQSSGKSTLSTLLKGLVLKSKLQYFGHLMQTADSCLIGKVPDAGKDWGQKEKRASEDERASEAGWHHWCSGHELGQTLEDGEGQKPGMLQSTGCEESDSTEQQQIALKAELDLVGEAEGRTKDDLQVVHLSN